MSTGKPPSWSTVVNHLMYIVFVIYPIWYNPEPGAVAILASTSNARKTTVLLALLDLFQFNVYTIIVLDPNQEGHEVLASVFRVWSEVDDYFAHDPSCLVQVKNHPLVKQMTIMKHTQIQWKVPFHPHRACHQKTELHWPKSKTIWSKFMAAKVLLTKRQFNFQMEQVLCWFAAMTRTNSSVSKQAKKNQQKWFVAYLCLNLIHFFYKFVQCERGIDS